MRAENIEQQIHALSKHILETNLNTAEKLQAYSQLVELNQELAESYK